MAVTGAGWAGIVTLAMQAGQVRRLPAEETSTLSRLWQAGQAKLIIGTNSSVGCGGALAWAERKDEAGSGAGRAVGSASITRTTGAGVVCRSSGSAGGRLWFGTRVLPHTPRRRA